jgi:hypothetical protein
MGKLKIVIYGIGFFFILTGGLHAAELNESFLGLKWGTHISELPRFKKLSGKDDVAYYKNPDKVYSVFEVENPSVIYGFYKDQFFATYIQVNTFTVFERVKEHISEKFGPPKTTLKMKARQTIHKWKHKDIKIKLKLYELEGKMKLAFYYKPLSNKLNEAQEESFPTATERVFTLDEETKKEINDELKLNRRLNVMSF